MEDKIEVGEYVRTKNGEIGKIIVDKDNPLRYVINEYGQIELHTDIVKHSKYKLELIEQDDYVNGYKVLEIRKHFEVQPYRITVMVYKTKDAEFWKSLEEQDIEDIVTKEQFESVKYKVQEAKDE